MAGVSIDWQLGCVEVKQSLRYLLKSGQWSDCTFLVGAEPDQVVIAGHKLVLAMASPVFEAMFYGGMAERNDPIPILDVQPEAFRALLEYIYTDNINISSFDIACQLYYAAKKYMLPHLVKKCSPYLWSHRDPRLVCRSYELARLFEENVHMDKCIQIISLYTKEVLTDSSFEDVELNTVITVFSLDHLNIDSELDLFEAAMRYAKAQDKRTSEWSVSPSSEHGPPNENRSKSPGSSDKVVNVEGSAQNSPEAVMATQKASDSSDQLLPAPSGEGNNRPDPKSDKPTIRSAIEKIRFLTLTPQQFAEGPARSSLLTKSETFAVLMNIASRSSDVAMPSGFSTCRVPRKRLIEDDIYARTWLEDNKFEFLEGDSSVSEDTKKILTKAKLIVLMNANETRECIKGWIQDKRGNSTNEDWFMRALTQAICEHALFEPSRRDVPHRDSNSVFKFLVSHFNRDRMDRYASLIHEFGETTQSREASCLFGVQQLIRRLGHPQALTLELFQYLHEQYIISCDGFIAWEESEKEPEGKDVMMKALRSFFTNMKEAYYEDSCSED